jgi:hypothetical protein
MPELACPNPTCGGHIGRRFGTVAEGSYVPGHQLRCEKGCGFTGLIKGKVLPKLADGAKPKPGYAPTKGEMIAGFREHIDRMWWDGLKEISLVDSLD